MIHLTIQDVALLANLADCCNTVDEFVEYFIKTHGWGDTPLSARQNHDGEFVTAYETIQKLKHEPQNIDFTVTDYVGAYTLSHEDGAKANADLTTLIYGGLCKLGLTRATDYRVDSYSSVYRFRISRPETYHISY